MCVFGVFFKEKVRWEKLLDARDTVDFGVVVFLNKDLYQPSLNAPSPSYLGLALGLCPEVYFTNMGYSPVYSLTSPLSYLDLSLGLCPEVYFTNMGYSPVCSHF